jgi:hypothetical protein
VPPSRAEDEKRPRKRTRPIDEDDDERPRPKSRVPEEDDDRPRRKKPRRDDDEEDDHRDGIPDADDRPRKKPRPRLSDKKLTPEEKRQKLAEFHRGMYGTRLVQISLFFYIPAVLFVPLQQIMAQITKEEMAYLLVIAGIFGLVNWVIGLIGISLCLSGPEAPGHYRFGIASIVASIVHGVLLLAVVAKTSGNADYRGLDRGTAMWAQIATQYESLSFYLSYVIYPDDIPLRRSDSILSFITGVAEMTRLVLYLMMLSCLAQAAGDRELSDRCTRMAGRVTIIPGLLAIGMLIYKVIVIETGAGGTMIIVYALNYMYRGITLVVAGILGMTTRAVGDVVEACEFPYQSDSDLGSVNESVLDG